MHLSRRGMGFIVFLLVTHEHFALGVQPLRDAAGKDEIDVSQGLEHLQEFTRQMGVALAPYQQAYRQRLGLAEATPTSLIDVAKCERGFGDAISNKFLPGCLKDNCLNLGSLEEAQEKCCQSSECGGVTRVGESLYQLRRSTDGEHSPSGEMSWQKAKLAKPKAVQLWEAFAKVVDTALSNSSLHLRHQLAEPRNDDSIFLSIASYRDDECPATLRRAFEQSDKPTNLYVGIVQENCVSKRGCKWATGWAETRRIIDKSTPDEDCVKAFCTSAQGKPHCKAGRVRILRLPEALALGPFFTRYLNSHLWRGETFYMQVDAHVDFMEGWDTNLIKQMKLTASYPHAVISNYPPQGNPFENKWLRRQPRGDVPSALCAARFESLADLEPNPRMTMRMDQSARSFMPGTGDDMLRPRHSGFIAAGFFIAHSSFLHRVPFDPFMPFLFMGEEIVLSARLWSAGFDIYAPAQDVVSHDYGRHEAPKFWETVNMVFDDPSVHNQLTTLLIQRVQNLIGFPEAKQESQLTSTEPSLLIRLDQYGPGHVRSIESFVGQMNIDLKNKHQSPPKWCTHGQMPPIHAGNEL